MALPDRDEAAEYYFTYINQVPDGDICEVLAAQLSSTVAFLQEISETQSRHRYAPEKWSIREVLNHLSDCERLFTFRAFWFARGFESPLPSFDQNVAVGKSGANEQAWRNLVEEFQASRAATLTLFQNLPGEAWARRGIASGNPFTVRALAFIAAGHVEHHLKILRERYLPGM